MKLGKGRELPMPPASPDPAVVPTPAQVSADQGWKLLSTVNEWIRFADAKAGAPRLADPKPDSRSASPAVVSS